MIQLKREDSRKNAEIVSLESQLRDFSDILTKEKFGIINKYESVIETIEETNQTKSKEISVLQHELQKVKEFRQNKDLMQREISKFKNQLTSTSRKHDSSVADMADKFQGEKKKLEKEAAGKISALAQRAHNDAVAKMLDTTKQVYHDNIKLMDAMTKHTVENQGLQEENQVLCSDIKGLLTKSQSNDLEAKQKILKTKSLKNQETTLNSEVQNLSILFESNCNLAEAEAKALQKNSNLLNIELQQKAKSLKQAIELQEHEMRKLRRAAKRVKDERSDVESYLIAALNEVGKIKKENGEEFDIGNLKWYERENILRSLFAQMNAGNKLPRDRKSVV